MPKERTKLKQKQVNESYIDGVYGADLGLGGGAKLTFQRVRGKGLAQEVMGNHLDHFSLCEQARVSKGTAFIPLIVLWLIFLGLWVLCVKCLRREQTVSNL